MLARDASSALQHEIEERCAREELELDATRVLLSLRVHQRLELVLDGSEIRLENHIQIVARRPEAIIGLFRPRDYTRWVSPLAAGATAEQAGLDG